MDATVDKAKIVGYSYMDKPILRQKKIWEKVLIEFARKGFYQNGLTLPFLIGASAYFEPIAPRLSIKEMISQMCTNPSAVSLIYCRGIAEPVFSMLDAETELLLQQSPKAFNCFGNLIIVDGSITGISSSAELISYLTDSYQTHVDLDEFSKNGVWGKFSPEDILHLQHVKSYVSF